MNDRSDNDMNATTSAPCDLSNDIIMTDRSPRETAYATTAGSLSASVYLPQHLQSHGSLEPGNLEEQSLHHNAGRSAEHATHFPHSTLDKRQQHEPSQYSVAEQGLSNPAMAYSRKSEEQGDSHRAQVNLRPRVTEQLKPMDKRQQHESSQYSVAEHEMSNPGMAYPRKSEEQGDNYRAQVNTRPRVTEQLKPMDRRQQHEPSQYSVAEHAMSNPAVAYPRNPEEQGDSYRAQVNPRPRVTEQQKPIEVYRTEKEGRLKNLHMNHESSSDTKDIRSYDRQEELQTKLTTKDQELRDLTDKLAQKDQEIDNIRRLWKGTAKELGEHQTRGKVVDQVTDPELIQKARQLQYNVRNFTYQHFGGEVNTRRSVQGSWQHLPKTLAVSTKFAEACMHSSVKRPMLVCAFLWAFLTNNIFGKFWWGGERVHYGMERLTETLQKPLASETMADNFEITRKYQMWKANTSALLEDALKYDGERERGTRRKLEDYTQGLCTQLASLTKSRYEMIAAPMSMIIQEALDLDQLMSKQVANIYWTLGYPKARGFEEKFMELQKDEKRTVEGQKVQLVVAPGLIKRGRSTGEDYGSSNALLKITVSCELIASDSSGAGHKPPVPPKEASKTGGIMRGLWPNTTK